MVAAERGQRHRRRAERCGHAGRTETNSSVLIGVDGKNFTLSGTDATFASTGTALTLVNRQSAYESNQVIAYMEYDEVKYLYENADTHAWCYSDWEWANKGIRAPADGGSAVTYGAGINNDQDSNNTRWRTDGLAAMHNVANSPQSHWVGWTAWGFGDCIDHGSGMTYGKAAGIDYTFPDGTTAMLEFTAETDHSSSSEQCIEANSSNRVAKETRYDWYKNWTNEHHYYWGSNVWFRFGVPGAVPHTIYTY